MPLRIEDYALIGNLQTAALVGKNGSIDWLCLPRFDSGACFSAILGAADQGHWKLEPDCSYRVTRRYREGTAVLETFFETDYGRARLIDCMIPEMDRADLIRLVEGVHGEVPFRMTLRLRFDYGSIVPWIQYRNHELMAIAGPDMIHLYSIVPFHGNNLNTVTRFVIHEGESVPFILNWHPSHEKPPAPIKNPPTKSTKRLELRHNGG